LTTNEQRDIGKEQGKERGPWKRGNEFLRCGAKRLLSACADKEQDKSSKEQSSVHEGGQSASAPHSVGIHSHAFIPLPRSLAMTALSGLLLAGALPHLDWGWLAWIGLVPFLSLFPLKNKRTAFAHGFTLGVFYLGVMAYWVGVFAGHIIGPALSVVGWALVTAYQAFYIGVWALGAQWLAKRGIWAWRLGVPALWAIVEWWRQSGPLGLGWGDLAYTQHLALVVLQVTKLTGIWGLAFLIVLVNLALAELRFTGLNPRALVKQFPAFAGIEIFLTSSPAPLRVASAEAGVCKAEARGFSPVFPAAVTALLVAALVYGTVTIRTEHLRPTFIAAALQGDINQNVDQNPAYTQRVVQTFIHQSRAAAALGATLTVWPETAYPGYLQNFDLTRAQVAAEAVRDQQVMLIGGVEYDWTQHKNANSLFLMDSSGNVTGSYQKRQLVPFGEFVPGRRFLPFLEALHVTTFDMKAGADTQPLLDGGPGIGKIGATICFESSYPRFLREQTARGAGLLVISTDDTWFGRTAAARQHSAIAAVRAAETDRYLIRSAATGVSQVIDPTGQVLAEAGLFRPAVVAAPVQSRSTLTPYVRWGDWFVGFCALLLAGAALGTSPRDKSRPSPC
jgi:apolipoprotein N-acyltransferase